MLCNAMKQAGFAVSETWEPTDGPIGRLIRQALRKEIDLPPETLCHLFAADRSWHTTGPQGITERCHAGEWVVSDRYVFSSYAYQGLSIPVPRIAELNRTFPLPETLFFIDVDTETSASRRNHRGGEPELFDTDPVQTAVRANYHAIIKKLQQQRPDVTIHFLDGSSGIEELHKSIWTLIGFTPIH